MTHMPQRLTSTLQVPRTESAVPTQSLRRVLKLTHMTGCLPLPRPLLTYWTIG